MIDGTKSNLELVVNRTLDQLEPKKVCLNRCLLTFNSPNQNRIRIVHERLNLRFKIFVQISDRFEPKLVQTEPCPSLIPTHSRLVAYKNFTSLFDWIVFIRRATGDLASLHPLICSIKLFQNLTAWRWSSLAICLYSYPVRWSSLFSREFNICLRVWLLITKIKLGTKQQTHYSIRNAEMRRF